MKFFFLLVHYWTDYDMFNNILLILCYVSNMPMLVYLYRWKGNNQRCLEIEVIDKDPKWLNLVWNFAYWIPCIWISLTCKLIWPHICLSLGRFCLIDENDMHIQIDILSVGRFCLIDSCLYVLGVESYSSCILWVVACFGFYILSTLEFKDWFA